MSDQLQRLERVLGYQFRDRELLRQALTHRSCGSRNNERLEFLGDSVLNFIVAEALYLKFEDADEGDMSRMRASLVQQRTLAKVAKSLGLGECLVLGSGEMKSGGHRRESILADAVEAILGGILLDADLEVCRERIFDWFEPHLQGVSPQLTTRDAKTALQEYLQGRGKGLPRYELLRAEGEDHCQQFTVACELGVAGQRFEGSASSRRKAEQIAAADALEALLGND